MFSEGALLASQLKWSLIFVSARVSHQDVPRVDFDSLQRLAKAKLRATLKRLQPTIVPVIEMHKVRVTGPQILIGEDAFLIDSEMPSRERVKPQFLCPFAGVSLAIYCIETSTPDAAGRFRANYRRTRSQLAQRTAKDNKLHDNTACLYVGSSVGSAGSLQTRIHQHLGFSGGEGTYALYLSRFTEFEPLDLSLRVAWYPTEDRELIQVLEDTMWDQKRPLFGRRGR